jgi:hypothetical protein
VFLLLPASLGCCLYVQPSIAYVLDAAVEPVVANDPVVLPMFLLLPHFSLLAFLL